MSGNFYNVSKPTVHTVKALYDSNRIESLIAVTLLVLLSYFYWIIYLFFF